MERLEHLIGKLKEQFEQNVDPLQMIVTVKLIEAELVIQRGTTETKVNTISPGRQNTKVAVVMPSSLKYQPAETVEEPVEVSKEPVMPVKTKQNEWSLNPLTDIPTLSHQPLAKELNDVIGSNGTSINDKLKGNVLELATSLKETPVRELKKAIGVNDRYVFINELFRGDEAMYERSIKTINNFRILPEAEYWMERELKIKLGWDDSRDITRQFYQLVKRRFA